MGSLPGETARHVLRRLRQTDAFVSGEELSRELALSRMAVSKAVRQLQTLGYHIQGVRGRGYRCLALTEKPIAIEVGPLLQTESIGRAFVYRDQLDSTTRQARLLAADGAPDGLTVVADAQGVGRGRCRRLWFSPKDRNLYVSVVLRPPIAPLRVPQLSLVTAVALRRALMGAAPALDIRVKWPNDIWVGNRKLAGILCEMDAELDAVRYVVVGMGINVNVTSEEWPSELQDRATSLCIESGRCYSRAALLAGILNELERSAKEWLRADDLTPFLTELARCSVLQGREIAVEQMDSCVEGRAEGIEPDGRLRLRSADGRIIRLSSGDAHVRPV